MKALLPDLVLSGKTTFRARNRNIWFEIQKPILNADDNWVVGIGERWFNTIAYLNQVYLYTQ